jgi:hypothetical protein
MFLLHSTVEGAFDAGGGNSTTAILTSDFNPIYQDEDPCFCVWIDAWVQQYYFLSLENTIDPDHGPGTRHTHTNDPFFHVLFPKKGLSYD